MAKDLSKGKPNNSICTKRVYGTRNFSILPLVSVLFDNPIDKFKMSKSRYHAEQHKHLKNIRKAKTEAKLEAFKEARLQQRERDRAKRRVIWEKKR